MYHLSKSILFLLAFIDHANARDYKTSTIGTKVRKGNGGENKAGYTVTYLTNGDGNCDGCSLCSGSSNMHLFDEKEANDFCVQCDRNDNGGCNKVRIDTSFEKAWIMRFFTLTSSNGPTGDDPQRVQMYGSWNNGVNFHNLLDTTAHFDTSDRKKAFQQIFSGKAYHTAYNFMRIFIFKKNGTKKIQLGGYDIRQDYLSHYLQDLNQDLLGVATFQISKITPARSTRIGMINDPKSQFIISFNIYLRAALRGHDGVLRFTQNYNSCCNYGDRNPAFITNGDGSMHNVCGSNRDGNHHMNSNGFNVNQMNTVRMEAIGSYVKIYVNNALKGTLNQHYSYRPMYRALSVWATDTFNGPATYVTLSKIVYRAID